MVPLKRITRFGYGDALAADARIQGGPVEVYGSNGPFDTHSAANTLAPCLIIGRKGSYGKVHFSEREVFAVDTTFIADRRHTSQNIRFLFYLLEALGLDKISDDTAVPGLSREKAYSALSPLPPLDIQQRIATYLDEKTKQIDALIARKQALLERLAEKRQAIITQAVTKGIDPSVPMKDSGIELLGQIPAHWEVKRLKYISPRVTVGIVVTPAAYYADEGTLALRGLNVRAMGFDLSETRNITPEGNALNIKSTLQTGDLVAVRTGAPGTTAVIPEELAGSNCIDLVIVRRPRIGCERFLGWFLNSSAAHTQYELGAEGALQQHFNVETSKEVVVTSPPPTEQAEISKYIDQAITSHDAQVDKVRRSADLLLEYRSALITAAATGQIKGLQ